MATSGSLSASASRTAERHTNGGQITRTTPATRVRAAIVSARSPASAGVVCIFQLPATMTARISESCQSGLGRPRRDRGVGIERREPLQAFEGALDGGAMDLEALGQL